MLGDHSNMSDPDAADIKSLTLTGTPPHEVKANGSKLDIACVWENGNPSVTARLLDRHGEELSARDTTGQIRYTFPAVGCQDAGVIRCEAPGARNKKTATLLVRCKFILCNQKLSGTPPDLALAVRLDNVKDAEGQWRLELANDEGKGHVDIHLSEEDSSSDKVPTTVVALSTAGAAVLCVGTVKNWMYMEAMGKLCADRVGTRFLLWAVRTLVSFAVRHQGLFATGVPLFWLDLNSEVHFSFEIMYYSLAGTPPDLTLTVRMDTVRKEDGGQWRLELTNDAGTGSNVFRIGITGRI
nr:hypothetical protein BaRGS_020718 [Batillaria attramentaria]